MKLHLIALGACAPILVGAAIGYAFTPKHVRALATDAPSHVQNKHELHDFGDADTEEVEIVRGEHVPALDVKANKPHRANMQGRKLQLVCSPPEAMSAAVPHGPKRLVYGRVQKCEWM